MSSILSVTFYVLKRFSVDFVRECEGMKPSNPIDFARGRRADCPDVRIVFFNGDVQVIKMSCLVFIHH